MKEVIIGTALIENTNIEVVQKYDGKNGLCFPSAKSEPITL